jgi:hypothetical protein
MVAIGVLALAALVSLVRAWVAGARLLHEPGPAVPSPYPAIPVEPGGGASAVAAVAIVWSGAHIVLLAAWLATGTLVPRLTESYAAAAYVGVAAAITVAGGLLLAARRSIARKAIAWGAFLLGVIAFMGGVLALLLPNAPDVDPAVAAYADVMLLAAVGHLVIDTAIGAAAQRVSRRPPKPVD